MQGGDDELFEPCRDDKCPREALHPAHPNTDVERRPMMKACPKCEKPLIRMPQKRGRCSSCSWRGPIALQRPPSIRAPRKKGDHQ
jgi:hypothetical protein